MPTAEICFVIMPFSKTTPEHTEEYWAKHFEQFLKPLIEELPNLEARRSTALRGDILREIITALVTSRVVVAELTDFNSNVYWELGVRQSFKHGTVTIAEIGTKLPFDIGAKGTLFYDPKDYIRNAVFRRGFKDAIKDCLEHPDRTDSHVLETISGRGSLYEAFRRDEVLRRLDALIAELEYDTESLAYLISAAERNQKDASNRKIPTRRCRLPATELLIINRYLDEPKEFFAIAEAFWSRFLTLNEQLNLWRESPNPMEKWILGEKDGLEKVLRRFKTQIEAIRKKLEGRV